jgi:hypothetical protein
LRLRIRIACTRFFSRVRCRTSCARREIRRRRTPVCSSGVHTSGRNPAASSLASVRASSLSVFADRVAFLTAFGLASTTRSTWGATIRAIATAFPVASSATRSSAARLRANSSSLAGLVSTRPARRTRPSSAIATSQKSRCTSSAIKRIGTSSHSLHRRRRGGRNDNYGSVPAAHPGSRRGGQLQTTGSQPIVSAAACPTSLLPEAPVPEQPPTLTRAPDASTSCSDLHAPTTATASASRSTTASPSSVGVPRTRPREKPRYVVAVLLPSGARFPNAQPRGRRSAANG